MKKIFLASVGMLLAIHSFGQTDTARVNKQKFSFEKTKNQRYISTDEIGVLAGLGGNASKKTFFSYQTVNSWQFERHAYIGPGTGLEVTGQKSILLNEGDSKSAIMIPLFAELRAWFLSKRVSPYVSEKTGYTFYLATPNPAFIGGAFFESQIGLKAFITRSASFNISVGYRMQCLQVPGTYASQFKDAGAGSNTSSKTTELFNFLSIHTGFCY